MSLGTPTPEAASPEMPAKPIDNERRACDAVVRVLEERHAALRANAHSPEDDRVGPPVEYVFDLAGNTYALEHTVVEAFDGQIRKDVDFATFVAPIEQALDHHMPSPGSYRLTFTIYPSQGLKPKPIAAAQAAIIAWVRETAAAMHAECPTVPSRSNGPRGHESHRRGSVEGIDLHLHREVGWSLPEVAYGRLFCGRYAPPNYETLRIERMRHLGQETAQARKLEEHRGALRPSFGNRDLSLSNHVVILEAAEEALKGRHDRPDEIWLVDTTIKTEWTVCCLMRDGVSFPDEETSFRYRDFMPDDLSDIGAARGRLGSGEEGGSGKPQDDAFKASF
jgi:hypothetical protein